MMGKILLVSLVSDQTIPNVQLIKEFEQKDMDHLFITTAKMEQLGTRRWIEKTCNIKGIKPIIVNPFSFVDIETKLKSFDFDNFDKIIVNLTGGTKVMTLIASDFFKEIAAEIYYITGNNDEYIKLHPVKKNNTFTFSSKITVGEYLTAYGFHFKPASPSGISYEQTKVLFDAFCQIDLNNHIEAIKFIHSKRDKKINKLDFQIVEPFLNTIQYKPLVDGILSKNETKYLSGDWFEEYIGLTLKNELQLNDNELFIGATISKERQNEGTNKTKSLLGDDVELSDTNFNNEMDVMFVYNNKFYSIECKTSIISYKKIEKNGDIIDKPYNILGETIYKSDSLKSRFGLYPKTSIVTLTNFNNYWRVENKDECNNKKREMEELINRANHSNIKLVDRGMLTSSTTIFELIK